MLKKEFSMWLNSSLKSYDDTYFGIVILVWIEMYVVIFTEGFTVNLEFYLVNTPNK